MVIVRLVLFSLFPYFSVLLLLEVHVLAVSRCIPYCGHPRRCQGRVRPALCISGRSKCMEVSITRVSNEAVMRAILVVWYLAGK